MCQTGDPRSHAPNVGALNETSVLGGGVGEWEWGCISEQDGVVQDKDGDIDKGMRERERKRERERGKDKEREKGREPPGDIGVYLFPLLCWAGACESSCWWRVWWEFGAVRLPSP